MGKATRFAAVATLAAALLLGSCGAASAAEKYVFGVSMLSGISVGSLSQMMKELAKVLTKKIGSEVTLKEMTYKKGDDEAIFLRILKEMKDGKLDFALVQSPMQYMKFKSQADSVMVPFFAMSIDGKASSKVCLYVRKDTPYKSVADLKGKVWGGAHTLQTRIIMNADGINTPMKGFFSKVLFVDDTNLTVPMDALLAKKIDAYSTISYLGNMARGANKKYMTDIRELQCEDFEHNWIFVYRKGQPKELVDKIRTVMLNSHKDKDFAQFKFMMTAIKGKFVAFDPANLAVTSKLVSNIKKYGWEKEEHAFIKANSK